MVSGQIVNGQVQSTYTETDQTKKKSSGAELGKCPKNVIHIECGMH